MPHTPCHAPCYASCHTPCHTPCHAPCHTPCHAPCPALRTMPRTVHHTSCPAPRTMPHSRHGCWWGEHVAGHVAQPVTLSVADRLVLSPHVYGHRGHVYLSHPSFPDNLAGVWATHWGNVPATQHVHSMVVLATHSSCWRRQSCPPTARGALPRARSVPSSGFQSRATAAWLPRSAALGPL